MRRSNSELHTGSALAAARPSWAPHNWDPRAAALAAKASMMASSTIHSPAAADGNSSGGPGAPGPPASSCPQVALDAPPISGTPPPPRSGTATPPHQHQQQLLPPQRAAGSGTGVFIPLAGATTTSKGRQSKAVRAAAAAASAAATRALSSGPPAVPAGAGPAARRSIDGCDLLPLLDTADGACSPLNSQELFSYASLHHQAPQHAPRRRATFSGGAAGPPYPHGAPAYAHVPLILPQPQHLSPQPPQQFSPTMAATTTYQTVYPLPASASLVLSPFTHSPTGVGALSSPLVSAPGACGAAGGELPTQAFCSMGALRCAGLGSHSLPCNVDCVALGSHSLPCNIDCVGSTSSVFDLPLPQRFTGALPPAAAASSAGLPCQPPASGPQGQAHAAAAAAAQAALQAASAALAVAQQAAGAQGAACDAPGARRVAAAAELLQRAQLLQQQISAQQHEQQEMAIHEEELWGQLSSQVHLSASCLGTQDSTASLGLSMVEPIMSTTGHHVTNTGHQGLGDTLVTNHSTLASGHGALCGAGDQMMMMPPQLADHPSLGLGSFSLWPATGGQAAQLMQQQLQQPPPPSQQQLLQSCGGAAAGAAAGMSFEQLVALQELSVLLKHGTGAEMNRA